MFGRDILFALWFFWPAGVATLLPVFAAHMPLLKRWDTPMDFRKTYRGKRLLGTHKTWRGFLAGWIGGSLWAWVQTVWYHHSSFVQSVYPSSFNPDLFLAAGILLSFGSVLGDAVGSFIKRRLDIPSGQAWFPWDQLDFILGGLICSLVVLRLQLFEYVLIVVVWLGVHLLFGLLGYLTRLKPSVI
jgi:CDP-2,3-bis-(O-geranylgeranyl)-sn-glycerol synthase